ncbi:hypothetical protein NZ698_06630 [Chryseobacterium sp. PBS4-4]|uniref:Uncharacterized protein n=1 Tax=Chryseobacterium edaphi TaxID=2976532 RepID=A0ABT2W3S1_9FLAO|nr:hypothetical protein [Chryseobacterium edaphi]MCU7616866.1 hypothetical protein [Chryseobacterium edaphi]
MIIFVICFALMSFIFVPKQKEYYLQEELDRFTENTYPYVAIGASVLLLMIIMIIGIVRKYKRANLINLLAYTIFISFLFTFISKSIFLSVILFINRQYHSSTEIVKYEVLSIDKNRYLSAYNILDQKEHLDEKDYLKYFGNNNFINLKRTDIISISTNKGIYGIDYLNK